MSDRIGDRMPDPLETTTVPPALGELPPEESA